MRGGNDRYFWRDTAQLFKPLAREDFLSYYQRVGGGLGRWVEGWGRLLGGGLFSEEAQLYD